MELKKLFGKRMTYSFHPEAEIEFYEAINYYEMKKKRNPNKRMHLTKNSYAIFCG